MPWDRKLWGVEISVPGELPNLIGVSWNENYPMCPRYAGEPSRALVFTTREAARDWCRWQMAKYAGRTDCCAAWRFRPVRVRETVTIVDGVSHEK